MAVRSRDRMLARHRSVAGQLPNLSAVLRMTKAAGGHGGDHNTRAVAAGRAHAAAAANAVFLAIGGRSHATLAIGRRCIRTQVGRTTGTLPACIAPEACEPPPMKAPQAPTPSQALKGLSKRVPDRFLNDLAAAMAGPRSPDSSHTCFAYTTIAEPRQSSNLRPCGG